MIFVVGPEYQKSAIMPHCTMSEELAVTGSPELLTVGFKDSVGLQLIKQLF